MLSEIANIIGTVSDVADVVNIGADALSSSSTLVESLIGSDKESRNKVLDDNFEALDNDEAIMEDSNIDNMEAAEEQISSINEEIAELSNAPNIEFSDGSSLLDTVNETSNLPVPVDTGFGSTDMILASPRDVEVIDDATGLPSRSIPNTELAKVLVSYMKYKYDTDKELNNKLIAIQKGLGTVYDQNNKSRLSDLERLKLQHESTVDKKGKSESDEFLSRLFNKGKDKSVDSVKNLGKSINSLIPSKWDLGIVAAVSLLNWVTKAVDGSYKPPTELQGDASTVHVETDGLDREWYWNDEGYLECKVTNPKGGLSTVTYNYHKDSTSNGEITDTLKKSCIEGIITKKVSTVDPGKEGDEDGIGTAEVNEDGSVTYTADKDGTEGKAPVQTVTVDKGDIPRMYEANNATVSYTATEEGIVKTVEDMDEDGNVLSSIGVEESDYYDKFWTKVQAEWARLTNKNGFTLNDDSVYKDFYNYLAGLNPEKLMQEFKTDLLGDYNNLPALLQEKFHDYLEGSARSVVAEKTNSMVAAGTYDLGTSIETASEVSNSENFDEEFAKKGLASDSLDTLFSPNYLYQIDKDELNKGNMTMDEFNKKWYKYLGTITPENYTHPSYYTTGELDSAVTEGDIFRINTIIHNYRDYYYDRMSTYNGYVKSLDKLKSGGSIAIKEWRDKHPIKSIVTSDVSILKKIPDEISNVEELVNKVRSEAVSALKEYFKVLTNNIDPHAFATQKLPYLIQDDIDAEAFIQAVESNAEHSTVFDSTYLTLIHGDGDIGPVVTKEGIVDYNNLNALVSKGIINNISGDTLITHAESYNPNSEYYTYNSTDYTIEKPKVIKTVELPESAYIATPALNAEAVIDTPDIPDDVEEPLEENEVKTETQASKSESVISTESRKYSTGNETLDNNIDFMNNMSNIGSNNVDSINHVQPIISPSTVNNFNVNIPESYFTSQVDFKDGDSCPGR